MKHTHSYFNWKQKSQEILDFTILSTTSIPQLEYDLAQKDSGHSIHLVTNTEFTARTTPYVTERRGIVAYRDVLGATLIISLFSYFEAYFFDAIKEIITFHGGKDEIKKSMQLVYEMGKNSIEPNNKDISKLRCEYKKSKTEKFRNHIINLNRKNFVWPRNYFMNYGLMKICEKWDEKGHSKWKAYEIVILIEEFLNFDMLSNNRKKIFETIRNERNVISHGKNVKFDFDKAKEYALFLKTLTKELDEHIARNFLIIENIRD